MTEILRFFLLYREAIFVFILSIFLGLEVIIGAIIVMGHARELLPMILGFIAVVLGTLNVVGGFVVTDRMLEMFRKKKNQK